MPRAAYSAAAMRSCSASGAAAGSPDPPYSAQVCRENWYFPRYWPLGETAAGLPEDSHWAIFASVAFGAVPEPDGIAGPVTLAHLGLANSGSGAATGSSGTASNGATATAPSATLAKIAACESGGNPAAVSPSGHYRGKYQFSRETWAEYGGTGDPAAAPESVQDSIAAKLLAARGTQPWPVCGK